MFFDQTSAIGKEFITLSGARAEFIALLDTAPARVVMAVYYDFDRDGNIIASEEKMFMENYYTNGKYYNTAARHPLDLRKAR